MDRERHCTFDMDVMLEAFGHRLKNILDLVSDVYALMPGPGNRVARWLTYTRITASNKCSNKRSLYRHFIRSEILQNFRKSNFFQFSEFSINYNKIFDGYIGEIGSAQLDT